MKIFYDHQIFSIQKFGGISRYFYELIIRGRNNIICPIIYSENFYMFSSRNIVNFRGKNRLIFKINQIFNSLNLYFKEYDIFHPTYYDSYFLKNVKSPYVVTVHDMIHEIYAGIYFDKNDSTILEKKKICENASGIIAISQRTKNDLIKILGIPTEKIVVIYHGSNLIKKILNIELPKKYILFIGQRSGYKNFNLFFEAISAILLNDSSISLLCIGSNFNSEERKLFENYKLNNQVIQMTAEDRYLYTIYKNALCLVFPSLYEGFGIPILEAFESECPVILSNASCFPEIADKAGEYFNPENKESIKDAVSNVIYNEDRRKELIKLGTERFKIFDWNKTHSQTINFYEEVIRNTNKNKESKENARKNI